MPQPDTAEPLHPYVVRTPGTCGGRARIDGSRIAVWFVARLIVQGGLTPEEFVDEYPGVGLAEVHDALAFFRDHREEIERDLREEEDARPKRRPRA